MGGGGAGRGKGTGGFWGGGRVACKKNKRQTRSVFVGGRGSKSQGRGRIEPPEGGSKSRIREEGAKKQPSNTKTKKWNGLEEGKKPLRKGVGRGDQYGQNRWDHNQKKEEGSGVPSFRLKRIPGKEKKQEDQHRGEKGERRWARGQKPEKQKKRGKWSVTDETGKSGEKSEAKTNKKKKKKGLGGQNKRKRGSVSLKG